MTVVTNCGCLKGFHWWHLCDSSLMFLHMLKTKGKLELETKFTISGLQKLLTLVLPNPPCPDCEAPLLNPICKFNSPWFALNCSSVNSLLFSSDILGPRVGPEIDLKLVGLTNWAKDNFFYLTIPFWMLLGDSSQGI